MSSGHINSISSRSSDEDCDCLFKIMMLGDSAVGKTSFVTRYVSDKFGERYLCTVGIDYQEKILIKNEKEIKLQIWDTAGQERYRNIAKSYFQSSNAFIVAYDISNKKTFNQLKYWVEQIKSISNSNVKCIIIGTKCDIEDRAVDEEEADDFAKKLGYKFFETSAKLNINVKETFESLLDEILLNFKEDKRISLRLSSKDMTKKQKKNCC